MSHGEGRALFIPIAKMTLKKVTEDRNLRFLVFIFVGPKEGGWGGGLSRLGFSLQVGR